MTARVVRKAARGLRRPLRSLDRVLTAAASPHPREPTREDPAPQLTPQRGAEIEVFLRSIRLPEEAREYLDGHMPRIVRTLDLVPPPRASRRALELGAYLQMTPALGILLGYDEVRAAYHGTLGNRESLEVEIGDDRTFRCTRDHFDVDRDRFPYDDGSFETVLACEILEHLLRDPMNMLMEIHRVLQQGGTLVLTTPNANSATAVATVLNATGNPQLYSRYPSPAHDSDEPEVPHVREYTPGEVRDAVQSAGLEIEYLFTEAAAGHRAAEWVGPFLQANGYPMAFRGEQTYCVAKKTGDRPTTRYPEFLYD